MEKGQRPSLEQFAAWPESLLEVLCAAFKCPSHTESFKEGQLDQQLALTPMMSYVVMPPGCQWVEGLRDHQSPWSRDLERAGLRGPVQGLPWTAQGQGVGCGTTEDGRGRKGQDPTMAQGCSGSTSCSSHRQPETQRPLQTKGEWSHPSGLSTPYI